MQTICYTVFPRFQILGLAALTVFELVNMALGREAYRVTLLSEQGGLVPSSAGFPVQAEAFDDARFDTVFVGAGTSIEPASPGLLEFVRRAAVQSRRIAAPCIGAFVLAEAGLLAGRRATTHWAFAQEMRRRYPDVQVAGDRIFVTDGSVWTSAGMTAAIDLALAMVESDQSAEVARDVARKLVVHQRRAGGQSQFSTLLDLEPKSDRIQRALGHASRHLNRVLSVEELADIAGLSPRQFSRAFHSETGRSPAKAVEHLRVEAARLMMEQGRHSMDEIARATGFMDRNRMRRAFMRTLGQPPQTIRRNARGRFEPVSAG